ncbi:MAG: T9SS type A sorting domain-containing protein [Rhodothermales bacterium]|nr:T9SS type A sorting domain-containing protein [Rhodothermales bacterium]
MVFAAQPFSLAEAESKTVTFAIAMGNGLAELEANMTGLENAYQAFVVSVDEPVDSTIPTEFALGQNYPNPFNPSTTISFSLPTAEDVKLRVFNVLGAHVETLVAGPRTAGRYEVAWDASRLASGIYFYRLEAGGYSASKSLVVLK